MIWAIDRDWRSLDLSHIALFPLPYRNKVRWQNPDSATLRRQAKASNRSDQISTFQFLFSIPQAPAPTAEKISVIPWDSVVIITTFWYGEDSSLDNYDWNLYFKRGSLLQSWQLRNPSPDVIRKGLVSSGGELCERGELSSWYKNFHFELFKNCLWIWVNCFYRTGD